MVGGVCQVTDPSMRWGQALVIDESRGGALRSSALARIGEGTTWGSSSSSRSSKDTSSDGAACVQVMRACGNADA